MRCHVWLRHTVVVVLALIWATGCTTGEVAPTSPADAESVIPTATPWEPVSPVSPVETPTVASEPSDGDEGPATTEPIGGEPVYNLTGVRFTDLWVEMPEDWRPGVAGDMWGSPDGESRIGAVWMALEPGTEAEAVLLPSNSQILESDAIETPLGPGRQFRLEVYGEAQQGEDAKADVIGVHMHVLVVVVDGDQRGAYDLYATSPTAEALDEVLPALSHMVETAKREAVSMPPQDQFAGIPAVAAARTRLAEHLSVASDAIEIVSAESVEWGDACLGIRKPDQMCLTVITPGYSVIASVDGAQYELHTNQTGSVVGIVP